MTKDIHSHNAKLGTGRTTFMEVGVVGLFLVALFTIALAGSRQLEQEARKTSAEMLRTVLRASYNSIAIWTESQVRNAEGVAAEAGLIEGAKQLLAAPRTPKDLLSSPAMESVRKLVAPELEAMGYQGFFIIAPDYTSVGSMRNANVGTPNLIYLHRKAVLDQVFAGESRVIPAITSDVPIKHPAGRSLQHEPTMFVAVPIHDAGKVIAVLTLRLDPVSNFSQILEDAHLGGSGETYAFDKEGWLITQSRFEEQLRLSGMLGSSEGTMLNVRLTDPGGNLVKGYTPLLPRNAQPLTLMAQSATQGMYGVNVDGYRDYRGVRVFGAWSWDDSLGFGIATKIDESEALNSYNISRGLLLAGYGLTAVLAIMMALYLSHVRKRAQSDLQEAHDGLEVRIDERTSELVSINERLHGEIVERVRTEEKLLQAQNELEQANVQLERLASLDGLTGLANRRIFNETLVREWRRCIRDESPISLLMFDIDHFKLYNDTYGHQAGDACLRAVGAVLSGLGVARRPGDLIARYGGEEFGVILSNSTSDHAVVVAKDVISSIERLAIPHSASEVEGADIVTVSVGVATMHPVAGESAEHLVERADEALYCAKGNGRNRYETSPGPCKLELKKEDA